MSDGRGHSFPEYGGWAHYLNMGCFAASTIASLSVVWVYNRFFEIMHCGLNDLLVVSSVGTFLLGLLRVTVISASMAGKTFTTNSCNIVLSAMVALITMISAALAGFYIHIQMVRRRGDTPTRRYLPYYYTIIFCLMVFTATFSAFEYEHQGGNVTTDQHDGHQYCRMPIAGEVVFLVPAFTEFLMLGSGTIGILQILCRRQSLSHRCKVFLLARALFVTCLMFLRTMSIIYHFAERKEEDMEDKILSAFAFMTMIFDSLMGSILAAMFFWMEGGWRLLKRMWRRRYRRLKRRLARAELRKMRDTETSARRSQRIFEEEAGGYTSRTATYGSARAEHGASAVETGYESMGGGGGGATGNSLAASRNAVDYHQQQHLKVASGQSAHVKSNSSLLRSGPFSQPQYSTTVDTTRISNSSSLLDTHHRRLREDYSESTTSTDDDMNIGDAAQGDGSVGGTSPRGGVGASSPAKSSSSPHKKNAKSRRRKCARPTEMEKDRIVIKDTLSGMLANISDEIHGGEWPDADSVVYGSSSHIDSMNSHDDSRRFMAPPISDTSASNTDSFPYVVDERGRYA